VLTSIRLKGDERSIETTIRNWRTTGIPFFTTTMETINEEPEKVVCSSRAVLESWERAVSFPPFGVNSSLYVFIRERDVELAIIASRVPVKVISGYEKAMATGV
jgi:hypothetical protein